MTSNSDSSSPRKWVPKIALEKVATAAGCALFILALLVLTGWALNLTVLESFVPNSVGMKANSAIAMMLASFALLRRDHRDRALYSVAVVLIGALTLGEYFWNTKFGIDEVLVRDTHYFLYPGRMSQYTSIGFMILGLSLLLMNSRQRVMRQLSRGLAVLTGAVGTLAIVSHSYNTHAVNLIAPQNNVSIPTALGFLIGAIGIEYAKPSEGLVRLFHADNAGGMALRRLLPTSFVVILLCGLTVRNAQKHFHWENGFSLALLGLGAGACLVIGIVLTAADLEREDLARRESEQLFLLAAQTAPVMIWMSGTDKLCTYFNEGWLEFTGRSMEAEIGNGWADGVHPDDLAQCLKIYVRSFDRRLPFQMQYRLRRHDGEYRWIFDTGVPRFDEKGTFIGYIGSCVDVTDRKTAEEALSKLSGQLIQAQEQERHRIAREIHDDFQQRLAMLSIELDNLAGDLDPEETAASERLRELWNSVGELCSDLHSLSHRLHSSTLESLGLAAALTAMCEEFKDHHQIEISFIEENVPRKIPMDAALCLFRVAQEALQNVRKHSGAQTAEVLLEGLENNLHLSIYDDGTGFDSSNGARHEGMGIRSMEERLRLVNGRFEIHSGPMEGTKVDAWVPVEVTEPSTI